jgi:hypothetical protein
MGKQLTPIGTAVASAKGHYPLPDGRHRSVAPGEKFTVFAGLDKAKWFTVLQTPEPPAPAPAAAAAPDAPVALSTVAAVERKRRAAVKPPTADPSADDIA